jgi:hypothetical protein
VETKNGKEAEEKEGQKDEIRRQIRRALRAKDTESNNSDRRPDTSCAYLPTMRAAISEANWHGYMEMRQMRLYVHRWDLRSAYTLGDNRAADH